MLSFNSTNRYRKENIRKLDIVMTSKQLKQELIELLEDFDSSLQSNDIRTKVIGLVPAVQVMRKLGKSLIPDGLKP